ncbi:MAG: carbohydrate ABC transporter permease [Deinococcota bacterium]|nr:carbohydrate ABC transporter permease [Deinococcota bacterium]
MGALKTTLLYAILIAYGFTVVYPVFLMIMSSFKTSREIFLDPFALPSAWTFANYIEAWGRGNFSTYFLNSVFVTSVSVLIVLVVGSLAAYPLGRYAFRGRDWLMLYFLSGLMLPIRLGILPLFFLMRDLGLLNTPWSLIFLYSASGLPFTIFVLSNFFRTLPRELEEAARLDGASEFRIYAQVMLPLIRPALATVAIFNFIPWWNDFFFPLIFIRAERYRTLPLGLFSFFGEHQNNWALLFAGLTITALPLLVLYLFASRQIIKGLTSGALK